MDAFVIARNACIPQSLAIILPSMCAETALSSSLTLVGYLEGFRSGILYALRIAIGRTYSYYNRTGGSDDDERHINGHTAVSRYRSELCITDLSRAGENHLGSPGTR